MKDVEKFEKFEEMKKSEKNKNKISENNQEMVEEFIQLLIKNTRTDENSLRLTKAQFMYSAFTEHILNICKTLNANGVQFIIVGGTATGFHGFNRMTMDQFGLPTEKHDFDFWFNPTYENYYNILKAMKSLGKDVSRLEKESSPNPKKSFLKFEFEEFKIDFLPEIKGLNSFNESFSNSNTNYVYNLV